MTTFERIPDLSDNLILDSDSYKLSHPTQYPKGMRRMSSYFEARGGRFPTCTLFGLQYLAHRYLSKGITRDNIEEAADFALRHGEPFERAGWEHVLSKHGGRLPVRIRAIPEGMVVPTGNALYTVTSTDPDVPWLGSHLETMLVRLWEPSTIATASREMIKIVRRYLKLTSVAPLSEALFKVHDFGGRGVTCQEQARIAGGAHLLTFRGSDTMEGIRWANRYYHCDMAGFSIPATEHSTVCTWTRANEFQMVADYIRRQLVERQVPAGVPKLAACVADTYDVYNFTRQVTSGHLLALIKSSGGTFVVRPDSGDPLEVIPKILDIMLVNLGSEVTVNSKGYKVLPPYMRIIQGDGIDIDTMERILKKLVELEWSTENIAFGSGGGLLQKWNRDSQKWKLACSAAEVDGEEIAVQKDPITDPGKRSKPGTQDLILLDNGAVSTIALPRGVIAHPQSVMNSIFENGDILWDTTYDECRVRMAA